MGEDSLLGKIQVSPKAIASIVNDAIRQCYGVVGMASPTLRNGLSEVLQTGHHHRGVKVDVVDNQVVIDVYVVIEYGTRISEVAQNIMSAVKFRVEQALSMPVSAVNVYVQGVRISDRDV